MANKRYQWKTASRETRKLWVRVLREDEHSDEVIATFFGVTKGAIVGFRHRYLPELTFGKKATRVKVDRARFRDLLDLAAMQKIERENGNVVAIAPLSKEAAVDAIPAPPAADVAPPIEPAPEPSVPRPALVPLPTLCQWPMPGKSLKVPGICGARITTLGEKLCDTHLAELKKSR